MILWLKQFDWLNVQSLSYFGLVAVDMRYGSCWTYLRHLIFDHRPVCLSYSEIWSKIIFRSCFSSFCLFSWVITLSLALFIVNYNNFFWIKKRFKFRLYYNNNLSTITCSMSCCNVSQIICAFYFPNIHQIFL